MVNRCERLEGIPARTGGRHAILNDAKRYEGSETGQHHQAANHAPL
jgi:hypothetical protein